METIEHRVPNGAGWELSIHQAWDPARLVRGRSPVVIVPGLSDAISDVTQPLLGVLADKDGVAPARPRSSRFTRSDRRRRA